MDEKKEKILKHIDSIVAYAKQPGNEWLLEYIYRNIGYEERFNQIYEYCIEEKLNQHASDFYIQFPIVELVPQLTEDFKKMEMYYRRGNFDEFCMAIYQQIECITTFLSKDARLMLIVERLMGHLAFVKTSIISPDGAFESGEIVDRTGKIQVAKLLFGNKQIEKSQTSLCAMYAKDKMNCILYFVCYKTKLKNCDYQDFVRIKDLLSDIYEIRNRNHRGAEANEWQRTVYERIDSQHGLYTYFFLETLFLFVKMVVDGYKEINDIYKYAENESVIPIKNTLNIVGKVDLSKIPSR